MEEILKHFHTLNEQLLEKMYKEKAEDIMRNVFLMRMEQFYEKFDKECMEIPISNTMIPSNYSKRISYVQVMKISY